MKWLLVWIVAGASGADLPQGQTFSTEEACEAAAGVLNDLSEGAGATGRTAPVTVKAGCIEIEEPAE